MKEHTNRGSALKLKSVALISSASRRLVPRPIRRYGGRLISSTVGDLSVDYDGLELWGSWKHKWWLDRVAKKQIAPYMTALFQKIVQVGDTVVDLGAYVGYYSLFAARAAGQSGSVFAFEPDRRSASYLRRNIQVNGFDNCTIVEMAVADGAGECQFYMNEQLASSSLVDQLPNADLAPVSTTSLDLFMPPRATIDVLKMDIQGAEMKALLGMTAVLNRSPHPVIFTECSPRILKASGTSVSAFLSQLEVLGFGVQVIDERNRSLCSVPDVLEAEVNLLCRRSTVVPTN